jgi:hypothetical protein
MSSAQAARPAAARPRVVTIHQPDFLPWLGFFQRWQAADLYVVLDDVQFIRRGWHHRDRVKTARGPAWLTVPVRKKGRFHQLINQVELAEDPDWRTGHLDALAAAYAQAPNRGPVLAGLERIYARGHARLVDLNLELLVWAGAELGIETPYLLSSELGVEAGGTERLAELARAVGGAVYLTGTGSRDYLDQDRMAEAGLEVRWQEFRHPVYPQLHGEFAPMLSVVDYLMMRDSRERRPW